MQLQMIVIKKKIVRKKKHAFLQRITVKIWKCLKKKKEIAMLNDAVDVNEEELEVKIEKLKASQNK